MTKAFYDAVQSALEAYACELGAEPWFYAAAGFAAAGQGVGALAATVGGIATATACNKPPTGPTYELDDPLVTFQSPLLPAGVAWGILYEGSYITYDQTKPPIGGSGTQCDYQRVDSYRVRIGNYIISRQIKLGVAVRISGGGICGTSTWGGMIWTWETQKWAKLSVYTWTGWSQDVSVTGFQVGQPDPPR